ncbi:sentrin-specific protease 1-like isoform X2 [Diachasmimorpha longicaudata]
MLFDMLKKFLGWCDEGSRKRHASDHLFDDYTNVAPKKQRMDHPNHREIIEIEDTPDDIQICNDSFHSVTINSHNSLKRRSTCYPNHKFINHVVPRTNVPMSTFKGKSRLNVKAHIPPRMSVLDKIHQLRDKADYSRLLQDCNPRIQVIPVTPDNGRSHKPIELIDIESMEPSTSGPSDVFSTPLTKTPSRWYTPMSRLRTSGPQGRSIEVIKLDDNSPTASSSKPRHEEIKKTHINRECIATNSLRDRLSGKAVMKEDFIPRIAEPYNERIEKKSKEAAELERMRGILAKHNRLQREFALEEQLARSMRLYEAVLEEQDDEDQLPELSSEMTSEVQRALIPRPPDEVLAEGFGLRITRKDIHTLSGLNWLNDEVINFYMNLLIERGKGDKYPNVYAMNTFFYPKLVSGGHSALKRWTRKVDIFAQDIVVVPVHLQMHWCMSIIDFRDKSIRYYDSMGADNQKCLRALRKYLEDESLDKKKKSYDTSDWTAECMSDIPQQMNGSDCGVFSCTFAEFICANRRITFSQDDMPYFRHKMVYEILKRKLL